MPVILESRACGPATAQGSGARVEPMNASAESSGGHAAGATELAAERVARAADLRVTVLTLGGNVVAEDMICHRADTVAQLRRTLCDQWGQAMPFRLLLGCHELQRDALLSDVPDGAELTLVRQETKELNEQLVGQAGAAATGAAAEVVSLLEDGAEVDCRDAHRLRTPLMWAGGAGHLEVVRLLLRRGADPKARAVGATAQSLASAGGHAEAAAALSEAGSTKRQGWKLAQSPRVVAVADAFWRIGERVRTTRAYEIVRTTIDLRGCHVVLGIACATTMFDSGSMLNVMGALIFALLRILFAAALLESAAYRARVNVAKWATLNRGTKSSIVVALVFVFVTLEQIRWAGIVNSVLRTAVSFGVWASPTPVAFVSATTLFCTAALDLSLCSFLDVFRSLILAKFIGKVLLSTTKTHMSRHYGMTAQWITVARWLTGHSETTQDSRFLPRSTLSRPLVALHKMAAMCSVARCPVRLTSSPVGVVAGCLRAKWLALASWPARVPWDTGASFATTAPALAVVAALEHIGCVHLLLKLAPTAAVLGTLAHTPAAPEEWRWRFH